MHEFSHGGERERERERERGSINLIYLFSILNFFFFIFVDNNCMKMHSKSVARDAEMVYRSTVVVELFTIRTKLNSLH
ncbi:MAG: hypothetical protein MJE68_24845 [Proteobacteria bacterium]|nr:hypothetical protein [Pseudomonadota bacterium]